MISGLKNSFDLKILLWDLLYDIAGSILYAAGIYTFAGNADFAPGGVTGLALILNDLTGFPVGTLTLLFNIPLVLISYKAVGKRLLLKSAKTMVIASFFLDAVFPVLPVYSGSRLMAALCSGVFLGCGMALFYIRGSSSGGIDFLTLTIKKKKPYLSIGVITMAIDLAVILLGWPVFGDVDAYYGAGGGSHREDTGKCAAGRHGDPGVRRLYRHAPGHAAVRLRKGGGVSGETGGAGSGRPGVLYVYRDKRGVRRRVPGESRVTETGYGLCNIYKE